MVGVQLLVFNRVQVPAYTDPVGKDDDCEEFEEDYAYFLVSHELGKSEHLALDAGLLAIRDVNHIYYNSQTKKQAEN